MQPYGSHDSGRAGGGLAVVVGVSVGVSREALVTCYTDPVANLTLVIDDAVLKQARKIALDRDTSVNQLVREYLEGLVSQEDQRARALAELKEMWANSPARIGDAKWTRDELHERR